MGYVLRHGLMWGDEDRAWAARTWGSPSSVQHVERDGVMVWETIPAVPAELPDCVAWDPPKDAQLSADAVSTMTAAAQFGYRANRSTRSKAAPKRARPVATKTAARSAKRAGEVDQLRARIRELEGEVARLGRLLAEKRRPVRARPVADDQAAIFAA